MTAPLQAGRVPVAGPLTDLALQRLGEALAKRVRHFGDGAFVGPHEIMGVLEEEVREAWDATRANQAQDLSAELLDVAVAALYGVASLWATGRVALPRGGGLTIAGDSQP